MGRSVAQGRRRGRGTDIASTDPPAAGISRRAAVVTGLALVAAALAVYLVTYVDRYYDHFVWQAAAFLEGNAAIRYPVEATAGLNGNAYFQDVLPIATSDGVPRGLLPFPPLPALLLVPFVAVWGLATDDQLLFTVLAAVDVGLGWWMLGRLPVGPAVRLGTTVFFAFGTVFWYTAQQSTTWFQAHVVAVGLTFLAIGLAVGADRDAAATERDAVTGPTDDPPVDPARAPPRRLPSIDRRQLAAGFLFGLACTARTPVVLGAPFFAFVGAGAGWRGRAWSAGAGRRDPGRRPARV